MEIQDSLRQAELRYADLVEEARRSNLAAQCAKPPAKPSLFSRILATIKAKPAVQPSPAARPATKTNYRMHKPVH